MEILIKNSIFQNNGLRPHDGLEYGGMQVFFHYPNQFSRSFTTHKRYWNVRKSDRNSHRIQFSLKDMEVLKKRQKKDKKCLEKNNIEIDDWFINHIIGQVKCIPSY